MHSKNKRVILAYWYVVAMQCGDVIIYVIDKNLQGPKIVPVCQVWSLNSRSYRKELVGKHVEIWCFIVRVEDCFTNALKYLLHLNAAGRGCNLLHI